MNHTSKQRNHAIDRAKILCAFLVIYAHLFHHDSRVRLYIYAFHMALFFFISGMFFKTYEVFWKGVMSYFRRLIVPAIFFDVLLIVLFSPLYHYGILPHEVKYDNMLLLMYHHLLNDFLHAFYNGDLINRVVWFLFALFWCNVFLCIYKKRRELGISLPIIVYTIHYFSGIDILYSVQGALAFPFFLIGNHYKSKIYKYTINGKWLLYMVLFLLCLAMTGCLTYFNGRISFKACLIGCHTVIISLPLFFINGLVGTWMIISLASLIPVKGRWVTALSKSLISTLGYQYLFIIPLQATCYQPTILNAIFISTIILIGCHLLHQVTEKYIPFCIGR